MYMDHSRSLLPPNPNSLKSRFALGFLKALARIRSRGSSPVVRRRKVKFAADAAMASAVGPRRVWSRAVLRRKNRRRCCFLAGQRRVNAGQQENKLRDLVPGGEEIVDIHKLLDETLHYINCLTTQVKVMKTIADICSSNTSSLERC